jgi:tetratricopeptide (TPR) repeat protein
LNDGEDPIEAFERNFATDVFTVEQTLLEYFARRDLPLARFPVDSLLPAIELQIETSNPAELLAQLGFLAARVVGEEEAERHFVLALAHDPEYPEALSGLGYVRDLQGRYEEAELYYLDAAGSAEASALSHLLRGRHLLVEPPPGDERSVLDRVDLARRALQRAVELDPSFVECRVMLALAQLQEGGDAGRAVALLQEAHRRLPLRIDILEHLLQAHLKREDLPAASRVLDGPLTRWATAEQVMAAREEIDRAVHLIAARRALEAGDVEGGLGHLDGAIAVTSDPELRRRLAGELQRLESRYGN